MGHGAQYGNNYQIEHLQPIGETKISQLGANQNYIVTI